MSFHLFFPVFLTRVRTCGCLLCSSERNSPRVRLPLQGGTPRSAPPLSTPRPLAPDVTGAQAQLELAPPRPGPASAPRRSRRTRQRRSGASSASSALQLPVATLLLRGDLGHHRKSRHLSQPGVGGCCRVGGPSLQWGCVSQGWGSLTWVGRRAWRERSGSGPVVM